MQRVTILQRIEADIQRTQDELQRHQQRLDFAKQAEALDFTINY